jgi:hypothetical protein
MSLPIDDILGIMADNLDKRGSIIPLSVGKATAWARGLDIPFGGDTIIYTGHMYQLIPSIDALAGLMAIMENSWITRFIGLGRIMNRIINISWFLTQGNSTEQKTYDCTLYNIARLLKTAGVKFGYLYEKELYSGALLYDEGMDDVFSRHAHRVYRIFKDNGAKHIITVDPHTTDMLKSIYPKIISDYDLDVKSYIEILAQCKLEPAKQLSPDVVIHDSCIYARYEGTIDEPRLLLWYAGVKIHEPELSGRLTHCCGGPLESLFPAKAYEVAGKRVAQLADCGNSIVTMCPICMANLRRAANNTLEIKDISEHLVNGYCMLDL